VQKKPHQIKSVDDFVMGF